MTRFTWKRASSSAAGADGWSTDAIGPSRSAPSYPGSSGWRRRPPRPRHRRLTARVGVFLRLPLRALGLLVRRVLVRPAAPTVPAAPESLTRIFGGLLLWGFRGLVRGIFVVNVPPPLGVGCAGLVADGDGLVAGAALANPEIPRARPARPPPARPIAKVVRAGGLRMMPPAEAAVARRSVFLDSVPDVWTTSQPTESPL